MKRSIILIVHIFLFNAFNSQVNVHAKIEIEIDTISVPQYTPEIIYNPEFKKLLIEFEYGDYNIINPKSIDVLKNATIQSIDLVYTKFPRNQNLSELNRKRIEFLHLLCPSIFNNTLTQWRIVTQTKCKNEAKARELYHGYVIVYKPAPTIESAASDLNYLKNAFAAKRFVGDSSIFKIFKRNRWKNITVIADLTGSMAPYLSQVFLWYKLTFALKNFNEFIFFNDGNMTNDEDKKTGKTGGIYYCKGESKETVISTATKCMKKGYGGDIQENNLEAVLLAIEKNPNLKEVIMIADNWAPMRDYALMSKVKIPIHVILCGQYHGIPINTEYLDLARHTNGSIHTIEEDIDKLVEIAEGKSIKIEDYEYKIIGGKFVKTH